MRTFVLLAFLAFIAIRAFSIEPRFIGYVEVPQRRAVSVEDYEKRSYVPSKERRAPLEGFEDMSGFLRQIDGIQKPRFGK